MPDTPIDLRNKCKDVLNPQNATLLRNQESVFVPMSGDGELLISFPDGGLDMGAAEVACLEKYTWLTNTEPQMFVENPTIGREKFEGVYRQAFVRRITVNDQPLIVLSLRRGYLTTVLNGPSIDYSEARVEVLKQAPAGSLSGISGGNTISDYLVVKFPNVSPLSINSVKSEISGVSADSFSPVIRGEAYGNDWHRLYIQDKVEADGSYTVLVYLARPEYSLKGYQMWQTEKRIDIEYHWNVPRTIAQTLIDAWKSKGHSATASYNANEELVDIILSNNVNDGGIWREESGITKQSTEYTSQYWNVYDPSLYAIPTTHVTGFTYQKDTKSNGDGTYDTTVREVVAKPTVTEFTAVASPFSHTYVITYQNADKKIEAGIDPASGEYRSNQQVNQFGLYDGTLSYEIGNDSGKFGFKSEDTAQSDEYSYLYRKVSMPIVAPEAPDGTIYQADNNLRDDGTYDAKLSERTAKEYALHFKSSVTAFRVESAIVYQNSDIPISGPESVTGSGEYRTNQQRNQFGRFDGSLTYAYGTDSGEVGFESMNGSLDESYTYIYKTRNSEINAPESSIGYVWQADNNLNPDGTYDAKVVLQKSHESYLEHQSVKTAFRDGTTIIAKNAMDVPDGLLVSGGAGIYRVNAGINRDGTYDYVLSYEHGTNHGETEFASARSSLERRDSVLYKSRDSQINAPASNIGYIYQADNNLTDDGTYDARLSYLASIPSSLEHQSVVTAFRSGSTVVAKNMNSAPSGLTVTGAGIYRVQSGINQDGTYDYTMSYEYGVMTGGAEFNSLSSALEDRANLIYKNNPTAINALTSAQGYIYQANNNLNDDGTYDANLSYTKSTLFHVEHQALESAFKSGSAILVKNSAYVPSGLVVVDDGIYRIQSSINADGTYDYSISYEHSNGLGVAGFQSARSVTSEQDMLIYKSVPAQVSAIAASSGYEYRVNNNLNDDGTYDANLVYVKSIPITVTHESLSTPFRSGSVIIARNMDTIPANLPNGGAYRSQAGINNDGSYDYTVSYEFGTNSGDALFSSLESGTASRDSLIYKNVASQVSSPASGQGYTYQATNSFNDDGTYDAILTYSTSHQAIIDGTSVRSAFRNGTTVVAQNVASLPTILPITGSGIYRMSFGINDDSTYNYNLSYESGTTAGSYNFTSRDSYSEEAITSIYKGSDSAISTPTPVQGVTYQADNSINDDGTYDSRAVASISKEVNATAISVKTAFRDGSQIVATNSTLLPSVPTVTGDGAYRLSFAINNDATYNYNLQYEKGSTSNGARFDSVSSFVAIEATVVYRNLPYQIDAPASAQGYVYRADNSLTDEGTYNSRLSYLASVEDSFSIFTNKTPFSTETIIKTLNASTLPAIPTPDSGSYQASARMNENGTYDYDISYKEGTNSSAYSFQSGVNERQNEYSTIGVGQSYGLSVPAPVVGHTYRVSNEIREDGLYNTRHVDEQSKAQSMSDIVTSRNAFSDSISSTFINANGAYSIGTCPAGYSYVVQNEINPDGTYNYSVRAVVSNTNVGTIDVKSSDALLAQDYICSTNGTASPVGSPVATIGNAYQVENRAREDGLFDYVIKYSESKEADAYVTIPTSEGDRTVMVFRNQKSIPASLSTLPTSGPNGEDYNNTASVSINTDGTYDVIVSANPSSSSGGSLATTWPRDMTYQALCVIEKMSYTLDGKHKPMRRNLWIYQQVGIERTFKDAQERIVNGLEIGSHTSKVVAHGDKKFEFDRIYQIEAGIWFSDVGGSLATLPPLV